MSMYVRKIDKAKWMQNDIKSGEDVSADAVTNCTKTHRNTLSLWHVKDEQQIEEAVLALVAKAEHLDTIDVVVLPSEKLISVGLTIVSTPGDTPVPSLVETHADISNLTYSSLGRVATCIVEGFREDRVKRFTRAKLKQILISAIEAGRVERESVPCATKLY